MQWYQSWLTVCIIVVAVYNYCRKLNSAKAGARGREAVLHFSLLLMSSLNKTETAIFCSWFGFGALTGSLLSPQILFIITTIDVKCSVATVNLLLAPYFVLML